MTIEAIKQAISELPEPERHSLAAWLNELELDEWDRQMRADFSPNARGQALVERIKRQVAEGQATSYKQAREQAKIPKP